MPNDEQDSFLTDVLGLPGHLLAAATPPDPAAPAATAAPVPDAAAAAPAAPTTDTTVSAGGFIGPPPPPAQNAAAPAEPPPADALKRAGDGAVYWHPVLQTIGGPPLTAADKPWVTDFLDFYGLAKGAHDDPDSSDCVFNDAPAVYDQVADIINQQAKLAHYTGAPSARAAILERVAAQDPAPGGGPPDGDSWQQVVQGGVQYAGHWNLATLKKGSPDLTHQVQLGMNLALHPDGRSGPEIQGFVQFGWNQTTNQVSTVFGTQGALVQQVTKFIQTQQFIQAAAGAIQGKVQHGQVQLAAGAQAALVKGAFTVGIQFAAQATATQGSDPDLGATVTGVVGFSF